MYFVFFLYVFVFCALAISGNKDYNRVYETVSETAQQNLGPADSSPGTLFRPGYYLFNLKTLMIFHCINTH